LFIPGYIYITSVEHPPVPSDLLYTDSVIGCKLPSGFVEESNFVKMKTKVKGKEARWIVAVSDVTSE
jgi:hypothetical protein